MPPKNRKRKKKIIYRCPAAADLFETCVIAATAMADTGTGTARAAYNLAWSDYARHIKDCEACNGQKNTTK
jgi:hypothetical protein